MLKHHARTAITAAIWSLTASPLFAQTQYDMNASAASKARAADAALNAQYRTATAKLSGPSRVLLRNAQRSWIAFRDAQCKFETSGAQGGTAYPMVEASCMTELTGQRTAQLKKIAQCQEGDLACPR